jgi:hypothetical protein
MGVGLLNNSVYVEAATRSSVKLSDSSIKVAKGDSVQLNLKGASGTIKWKSSKEAVAKVTSKGKVSAVKEGTATITATYNKKSYNCKVTVTKKTLYTTADSLTIFQDTTIVISTDLSNKDERFSGIVDDYGVADFEWGDWIDSNNVQLTIKPKKAGSTKLRITSNKSNQELVISIKVVNDTNFNDNDIMTAKQIYAKCKSATAQITTDLAIGSGFYIAKGKLITNYHVIKEATSMEVMNTDGNKYHVKEILGYDEALDIAILSVSCKDNDYLTLNTHGLTTGEDVYAFGNPLGLTDTFTAGVIENTGRYVDSQLYVQSSAPISSGNSGGALVNAYGEVIGINSAHFTGGQNLNLAIPIHKIFSVSTYNPMTFAEFVENSIDEIAKKIVIEDKTKSGELSTAQVATIGYYIYGTFDTEEVEKDQIDVYKFVVTKPGYYELQVCDLTGKNGLYVGLYSEKDGSIGFDQAPYNMTEDYSNKESAYWIQAYLPEGTYYLGVFNDDQVQKNSDTNYLAAIFDLE